MSIIWFMLEFLRIKICNIHYIFINSKNQSSLNCSQLINDISYRTIIKILEIVSMYLILIYEPVCRDSFFKRREFRGNMRLYKETSKFFISVNFYSINTNCVMTVLFIDITQTLILFEWINLFFYIYHRMMIIKWNFSFIRNIFLHFFFFKLTFS